MDVRISPSSFRGSLRAVSSKSDAHRLLLCAALSDVPTEIFLSDLSEDILATMRALRTMGTVIEEPSSNSLLVSPLVCEKVLQTEIDCRESGSTLRFLLPVAASLFSQCSFRGSESLARRPLQPLLSQMQKNGVSYSSETIPLTLSGFLQSGSYLLPGNISSQFLSGLLFALPLLKGESTLSLSSPLESGGYVEMTLQTLSRFHIEISFDGSSFHLHGPQRYLSPERVFSEGDWSGAAFFLALGALAGEISVQDLSLSSLQPDKVLFSLLQTLGFFVSFENTVVSSQKRPNSELLSRPVSIDVSAYPDLFPVLSVLSCARTSETHLVNASRLRLKESDRIRSVCLMLRALGANVEEHSDSLRIHGTGALRGGSVDGANDHRIVMAAAVASSLCESDVVIRGAQAVNKSYPQFFQDFKTLGGTVHAL